MAEVPELPGCMAHGDTQAAALANANDAMQLWLDAAKEFGRPIPEPKGQRLMLAQAESSASPLASRLVLRDSGSSLSQKNSHHTDSVPTRARPRFKPSAYFGAGGSVDAGEMDAILPGSFVLLSR